MLCIKEEEEELVTKPLKKRKCVIEDVIMKNKAKVEPLFVDFANGRPLDSTALEATLHQNVSKDSRRQRRRVLTMATQKLTYGSTNFGADTRQANATTTFLGVLDKSTGKMRLIETSSYCLRPMLSSQSNPILKSPKKNPVHSLTYLEKQEVIASAFGSKRAIQSVNRRKQYKVETENMTVAIDQAASSASMEVGQDNMDEKTTDTLSSILPPCDKEAKRVEDVYKLHELAPDYFLAALKESAEEHLEARYPDTSYSLLVIDLLSATKLEVDDDIRLKLCCLILYIHHLLCFLNLRGRELYKPEALSKCPPQIKNYIYREFTEGKQRVRSNQNEDRVVCLLVILSFIANKYQLSASILLQSLPLTRDRMNLVMKVIGATYNATNQLFDLKLPLVKIIKQPQMLGRREKKKRGRR